MSVVFKTIGLVKFKQGDCQSFNQFPHLKFQQLLSGADVFIGGAGSQSQGFGSGGVHTHGHGSGSGSGAVGAPRKAPR